MNEYDDSADEEKRWDKVNNTLSEIAEKVSNWSEGVVYPKSRNYVLIDRETLNEAIACLDDWYIMRGDYAVTRGVVQKLRNAARDGQ